MEYEGWKAGQALRDVRKSRHLTIEQLSERVNKSPSHINQIELGSRKMSVDLLYLLMTALHTDANTILGIAPKKMPAGKRQIKKRTALWIESLVCWSHSERSILKACFAI